MVQKLENEPTAEDQPKNPPSPKSRLAVLKRNKKPTAASDPFRFQGNGVTYKGKLIGERDVESARGDAMCADAMRAAKAAVKAAGAHKTRIILQINIDGIKIVDEKSNAVLHNFPVSRVSFIARDTTDARAFGIVFGQPDNKYKFYGIKTAQTADQAVLAIRDMFQVVFEMKKKHIEQVKQQQEERKVGNLMAAEPGQAPPAPAGLSADPAQATVPAAGGKSTHTLQNPGDQKMIFKVKSSNNNEYRVNPVFGFVDAAGNTPIEVTRLAGAPKEDKLVVQFAPAPADATDAQAAFASVQPTGNESAPADGVAVADLLDLETEVQQIQQGLQQLEQIPTGTDAFGATPFADPFQDSFVGNVSSMNGSNVNNSLNGSVQHVQPQFQPQFPVQTQTAAWPQQPAMPPQIPQPPMQMPVPPANGPFVDAWGTPQITHTHSTPAFMPTGFSETNPFASAVTAAPHVPPQARDPFDTRNVLQVPQPMPTARTIDWGTKENAAPQMHHANSFTTTNCFGDNNTQQQNQMKWEEPRKVTSLEEAFTKLVDMNALVARPANDTKKNPFDHILNPPKASLNALGAVPMRPAPAVMANHADPFGDDFFR
ncbi:hypothetical protein Y032_0124g1232 [Ancylostoma ceylanicum]|nr:hypothetical protein Y032_0124g1232 [Ancylostoma ceylanicum]